MNNMDIRQYAMQKRVNLWEVSEKLGYAHESSFSRILRHELTEKQKKEVFKAIDDIADNRAGE